MITLTVIPNFFGSKKEKLQTLLCTLFLDGVYVVPLIVLTLKP